MIYYIITWKETHQEFVFSERGDLMEEKGHSESYLKNHIRDEYMLTARTSEFITQLISV